MVKNLPAMWETWDQSLGWKRREWLPTPVFLPGESHGQRSLVGYRPWGHREQLPLSLFNYKRNTWLLCVHAQSLSYVRLCNHKDCSPPGSSVYGILLQEYRSGLPFPSLEDLPDPGIKTHISCVGRRILYH